MLQCVVFISCNIPHDFTELLILSNNFKLTINLEPAACEYL